MTTPPAKRPRDWMQRLILAAIIEIGKPCAAGDIRTVCKPEHDLDLLSIKGAIHHLRTKGAIKSFSGDASHYTLYGLEGWEVAADSDREITDRYQPFRERWGDPR